MRLSFALLALALLALWAQAQTGLTVDPKELPYFAPVSLKDAPATFQVRPGFQVELAAGEPMVTSPIAVCFDEDGRMFVLEMRDYSEQREVQPHLGRVRLLEDTDGDGRYDKASIFADDLPWPTGLIWANHSLFVIAAPDLLRFEDRDRNGMAEVREVIFTGFQTEGKMNVQALPNCFQWGPDNLIHLQVPGGSASRIRRPAEPEAPVVSGDFFFDPQTYAWGTEAGGGQYGMSYDNRGRRFVCNNSDHLRTYVYDSRLAPATAGLLSPLASIAADGPAAEVFRISPDEPWRVIRTRWRVSGKVKGIVEGGGRVSGYFTGATGTTVYRGDAFPPEYVGDTFTGDAGGNLVHHKLLRPEGASLRGERPPEELKSEFVASRDTWFRPVNFANAPDGTLYIIDMYREVIEHPASLPAEIKSHLDLTSGRDRGRIWRLAPMGFRPRAPAKLSDVTTAKLVATLAHANGWHRDTATRLLCERRDPAALAPLKKYLAESISALGRLHALRALLTLEPHSESNLLLGLADQDAAVRELALGAAQQMAPAGQPCPEKLMNALLALAHSEPDPRCCMQLIFTLGHFGQAGRQNSLTQIARRQAGEPWIRAALLADPAPGALFRALCGDPRTAGDPLANPLLESLAKRVAESGNQEDGTAVLNFAGGAFPRLGVLAGFGEGLPPTPAGTSKTLGAGHADAAPEFTFPAHVMEQARTQLRNTANALPLRLTAIRLLAFDDAPKSVSALVESVENARPAALRTAALAALARSEGPTDLAPRLLAFWPRLDAAGRAELAQFLTRRPTWSLQLLWAIEKRLVTVAELGPVIVKALQESKFRQVATEAAGLLPPPAATTANSREQVLKGLESALLTAGDKSKGHELFLQRCATCHRLRNEGNAFGPDLESVITGGKEKLLTHLVDPNREVAPQYAAYTIELKDGTSLSGVIASETPAQVVLREPLGKETALPRAKIARLQTTGRSPMPEGLEAGLTPVEVAGLLEFLVLGK